MEKVTLGTISDSQLLHLAVVTVDPDVSVVDTKAVLQISPTI